MPASILGASKSNNSVSLALQCYHTDGGPAAWAMLEGVILDADGHELGRVQTNESRWFSYNADSIFRPGEPDTGSSDEADQRGHRRSGVPTARRLARAAVRSVRLGTRRGPQGQLDARAEGDATLEVASEVPPVSIVQLSAGHYFFDFGVERMGGLSPLSACGDGCGVGRRRH